MAKPKKLKVYRTPIGFHDAYVAAPSQKAALEAWGSDADLFARGIAKIVTDAALTAEPLANPGTVVKRMRGTAAEQIAEAAKSPAKARQPAADKAAAAPVRKARPRPRPGRDALDAAEAALSDADEDRRREERAIKQQLARLERELAALRKKHEGDIAKLERNRDRAADRYRKAMERWRR